MGIHEGQDCFEEILQRLKAVVEDSKLMEEISGKIVSNKINQDLPKVISTIVRASQEARQEQNWVLAVKLLEETILCCKTKFTVRLSEKECNKLKVTLLEELRDIYYQKGDLNDVGDVLDALATSYLAVDDYEKYFSVQLRKADLRFYEGNFSQSKALLRQVLDQANKLSNHQKEKILPEIQRNLGISYRGYGQYEEALTWFSNALTGFRKIKDPMGEYTTIWGIAILHNQRGEWKKAIEKYKELLPILSSKEVQNSENEKYKYKLGELYLNLSEPLLASGEYSECEKVLQDGLLLAKELQLPDKLEYALQMQYTKIYLARKELNKALDTIQAIYSKIETLKQKKGKNLFLSLEIHVLELEIEVLSELDKGNDARAKLEAIYPKINTKWDFATWYLLMGLVEKKDMNLRSAEQAFEKAIVEAQDIAHYKLILTCQLAYISLLIERAKLGDQRASNKALDQIDEIESEVQGKSMPAMILETQLLRANLLAAKKNYDAAYEILTSVEENARAQNLNKQLTTAQTTLEYLERERSQLQGGIQKTYYSQVVKYLQDARRIIEESQ